MSLQVRYLDATPSRIPSGSGRRHVVRALVGVLLSAFVLSFLAGCAGAPPDPIDLDSGLGSLLRGVDAGRISSSFFSRPSAEFATRSSSNGRSSASAAFVENRGQWDRHARFMLDRGDMRAWFTSDGVVYDLAGKGGRGHVVRMRFAGGNASVTGEGSLGGRWSFIVDGATGSREQGVPGWKALHYSRIVDGVSARYYISGERLKYDLIAAPGSRPEELRCLYDGASSVEIEPSGDLRIGTSVGDLREAAPYCYQTIGGRRVDVPARFALDDRGVGLRFGEYDRRYPLVIDPAVAFSSFIGGAGADEVRGIALDPLGNIYVVGNTRSLDFPTTAGAYGPSIADPLTREWDLFVAKLDPSGRTLLYGTYIGGKGLDEATVLKVNRKGEAIVAGVTYSTKFPVTAGVLSVKPHGGADGFVLSLNSAGSQLLYSTYVGGNGDDRIEDIAINDSGNVFVVGATRSTDILTTFDAKQSSLAGGEDAFAAKLAPLAVGYDYFTYLGGSGDDHALATVTEPGGALFITGWTSSNNFPTSTGGLYAGDRDCFLVRIDHLGGNLRYYGTFFGGSDREEGRAIALDSAGFPYVAGYTRSSDFPRTAPFALSPTGSWFVTKFDVSNVSTLAYPYSRYIGPSDNGAAASIQVDKGGDAYICGSTDNLVPNAFPTTPDAVSGGRGGVELAFVQLDPAGGLRHSSVIGGSRDDLPCHESHLDKYGALYVGGVTHSVDFPTSRFAYDKTFNVPGVDTVSDGFVFRFNFQRRPIAAAPPRRDLDTLRCETSRRDTFWVHNDGDAPMNIIGHLFRVSDPIVYRVVSPSLIPFRTVAPGDSIRYIIEFLPIGDFTYVDTLLVLTNDSITGNPLRVAYRGTRAAPSLTNVDSVLTMRLLRPCQDTGTTSRFFLRNSGIGSIGVENVTLARGVQFDLAQTPTFPKTYRERDSFPVDITFLANGVVRGATYYDTILVANTECPEGFRIPIQGRVDSAAVSIVEQEIDFGAISFCGGVVDTVLTLVNSGDVALGLLPSNLSGTGFRLIETVPILLEPGESRRVKVRFDPPTTAGSYSASLLWEGTPCDVTASVTLRGERLDRGGVVSTAPEVDFPTITGCEGMLDSIDAVAMLRNITADSAVVESLDAPAPFEIVGPFSAGGTISGNGEQSVQLRYRSSTAGNDSAVLTVAYRTAGCRDTLRIVMRAVRERYLVESSATMIEIPELVQCQPAYDTTVVLYNRSGKIVTVTSYDTTVGLSHQGPISPFEIPAGGSREVRLHFAPRQAGENLEGVVYHLAPCDDSIVIQVHGRKQGAVLTFAEDAISFPTRLDCHIGGVFDTLATLLNRGDSPAPAVVDTAFILGDPGFSVDPALTGSTIGTGSDLPFTIQFAPQTTGTFTATLAVVVSPCRDTLRIQLHGEVVRAAIVADGGAFGAVRVNSTQTGTVTLHNPNPVAITIDSLANIVAPFRVVGARPQLPAVLRPGDSVEVDIEFTPSIAGSYEVTPFVSSSAPCAFTVPVALSGTGLDSAVESGQLCLEARKSVLAGDTIELVIRSSAPGPLSATTELHSWLRYDWRALRLLDVQPSDDVQVLPEVPAFDDAVTVEIVQGKVSEIHPEQLRVRFVALTGTEGEAFVRLDSARLANGERPILLCDDSAVVVISTRCVIGGIIHGKYRNLLEDAVPNPSGAVVEITYQQLETARAVLSIFDVNGKELLRPVDEELPGGRYTVRINVGDIPSGRYLYTLRAGSYSESKWLVIRR